MPEPTCLYCGKPTDTQQPCPRHPDSHLWCCRIAAHSGEDDPW